MDLTQLSDDELRKMAGLAAGEKPKKPWSASVLPLSEDEAGNVRFDTNAGLFGAVKRALTLPGDVAKGKVDPLSNEGIGRAFEMAGVVTPTNPAIRAGGHAPGALGVTGLKEPKPKPPSIEALDAASRAGYDQVRNLGVDYASPAVRDMASGLRRNLEGDGILEGLAPSTFKILDLLESAPEGSVAPIAGLEAARRSFGNAAKNFSNPTDQLAAKRAMGGLEEFMAGDVPGSVVAGPAPAAAKTLSDARGNYAAARRSERLAGVEEAAELQAAVSNSGANADNALRSRIAAILKDDRKKAGYSPEELRALDEVARGTPIRNTTRTIGNLLGGGGGLGATATAAMAGAGGAAWGAGPGLAAGLAAPLTGVAAKRLGNYLTERSLARADELVRKRSPLYEQMKADAPMEVRSPEARALLIKMLMAAEQADQ